jgi:hypothetical protein
VDRTTFKEKQLARMSDLSSVISSSRLPVAATAVPAASMKSAAVKSTAVKSASMEMTRREMMAIEVVSPIPPSDATEVRAINRTKKSVTSASAE